MVILPLCVFKFISWSISLGSGTSGGTLAPLLTIGSALGALFGILTIAVFPSSGVSVPLAALVGMSAMFAGASRALLTSIIFAIETTGQSNALLPLLAACVASYFISFLLLKNTIMTEKIARRGVATPTAYEPDLLQHIAVKKVISHNTLVINNEITLQELRSLLRNPRTGKQENYIVADGNGQFEGVISDQKIFSVNHPPETTVRSIVDKTSFSIKTSDTLRHAAEVMALHKLEVLPVVNGSTNTLVGILSPRDIITPYSKGVAERRQHVAISLKRKTLKVIVKGKKTFSILKPGSS